MRITHVALLAAMTAAACSSFAGEAPAYSAGKLLIPSADADGKPGLFQDVVIETAGEDLWRVTQLFEGIPIRNINTVELIKTDSFPVQVFLKVSGTLLNGCEKVGDVAIDQKGTLFHVAVYYQLDKNPPGTVACTASISTYSRTIPLPVYGLEAGTYQYVFDAQDTQYSQAFTLDVKNSL